MAKDRRGEFRVADRIAVEELLDRIAAGLAERLGRLRGRPIPLGEIELKRYGDLDDVLYTGRTLLAGVARLVDEGARRIEGAVLCARGGGEVPVSARFRGLALEVGEADLIDVRMPPYEEEPGIVLRHREER